jgi:hypothetical protein
VKTLLVQLLDDEAGFIISAELVLVATIAVLSMVVGLSGVARAIVLELDDMGAAFGALNQDFRYSGMTGRRGHRHRDAGGYDCGVQTVWPGRGGRR